MRGVSAPQYTGRPPGTLSSLKLEVFCTIIDTLAGDMETKNSKKHRETARTAPDLACKGGATIAASVHEATRQGFSRARL